MQLRLKLAIFTAVPILVALGLVAFTVQHQTLKLARQERELVGTAYLQSKESELRQYVQLAVGNIQHIATNGEPLEVQQRQALAMLGEMKFGEDGYFFVYGKDDAVLLNPRQMRQSGVDMCDPGNPVSELPAKNIIATARGGGGMVRYDWQKPSSQQMTPKLAYVTRMPNWGWVIGTGLYLDDVENTLRHIDQRAQENIHTTRLWIYAITAACMLLIAMAGLLLNISDHRGLMGKLRRLAQRVVRSQEEERLRVARDLHDGVVQVLVSSKFLLETAQLQMHTGTANPQGSNRQSAETFETGLTRLNDALEEIRRVSHGLRPALLDDLGLAAALERLIEQTPPIGDCQAQFVLRGVPFPLPISHSTALFRVAQEAIANAQRHAHASHIHVVLKFSGHSASLTVADDGDGFAVRKVQEDDRKGIGLRNMRERIEGCDGRFTVHSSVFGTRIRAIVSNVESAGSDWAALEMPPGLSA